MVSVPLGLAAQLAAFTQRSCWSPFAFHGSPSEPALLPCFVAGPAAEGRAHEFASLASHANDVLRVAEFVQPALPRAEQDVVSRTHYMGAFVGHLAFAAERRCRRLARQKGGGAAAFVACSRCEAGEQVRARESALLDALAGADAVQKAGKSLSQLSAGGRAKLQPDHVALKKTLTYIDSNEEDLESVHTSARKRRCRTAGNIHGYSCNTFLYGSTPFSSWLELMRSSNAASEVLRDLVTVGGRRDGRTSAIVLGSGLGREVFFFALAFGVHAIGYELLENRYEASVAVAQRFGLSNDTVDFRLADAVGADFSDAGFVYLTDLAWDEKLLVAVMNRLAAVLTRHVLVVSLRGDTAGWEQAGFKSVGSRRVRTAYDLSGSGVLFHFFRPPGPAAQLKDVAVPAGKFSEL